MIRELVCAHDCRIHGCRAMRVWTSSADFAIVSLRMSSAHLLEAVGEDPKVKQHDDILGRFTDR